MIHGNGRDSRNLSTFRIVGRAIQAQIRLQLLVRQRKEKTTGPMEDFEFKESPKPHVKPLLTTDM